MSDDESHGTDRQELLFLTPECCHVTLSASIGRSYSFLLHHNGSDCSLQASIFSRPLLMSYINAP